MKRLFVILFLSSFLIPIFAQRTAKVTGTYTYYVPENVTLEEAKRTALDRAKLTAIADEFGTLVTQSNSTMLSNENGKSNSRFFSLGGSEVKGEWIETIGEPQYKTSYDQGTLVVTVTVSGRIREIVSAGIDFVAKALRNGTEEKFESTEFRSGDDMYLYFRSPVDGYIAVYLLDEEPTAYCLLPYSGDGDGQQTVQHNKEYVFFSPTTIQKGERADEVDEMVMTCNSERGEHNQLYIVFSPHPFTKAMDTEGTKSQSADLVLPRQLPYHDFQQWLTRCRKHDTSMEMKVINLDINY